MDMPFQKKCYCISLMINLSDQANKSVLYKNILQYVNPSTELYQVYVREMEQFAMEQLLAGRMNGCLAVIYEHTDSIQI